MPDEKPAGETPATTTTTTPAPQQPAARADESSTKAYIEDLKNESIQHRLRAKAESERAEKAEQTLVQAKTAMGKVLLDREIERAAIRAGLRKPELASKLLPDLEGIEVDTEKLEVRGDISAKLEALKKDIPELFGVMPQPPPSAPKPAAGTQDPGAPPAGANGSIYEAWATATANGDRTAMADLMSKHGKEIGQHIDSLRNRRN